MPAGQAFTTAWSVKGHAFPAVHSMQAVAPAREYVPGGHAWMLRSSPVVVVQAYPARHVVQAVEVPGREYVPAPHVLMALPSVLGQTEPAGQVMQAVAPPPDV